MPSIPMPYVVKLSDGSTKTTIQDYTLDNSTSLTLFGRGWSNYGEIVATNFVHLLENAASNTAPLTPLRGQLWFNNAGAVLRVYNGSTWVDLITSGTPSTNVITLTGDATGSGTSGIAVTLRTIPGLTAGTFSKLTVNTKGLVTLGANLNSTDIATAIGSLITVAGTVAATNLTLTSGGGGRITFQDGSTQATASRIRLTGTLNLYVSDTAGLDTNPGTVGSPFKTIQYAINYVYKNYEVFWTSPSAASCTIFVADGTYTEGGSHSGGNMVGGNVLQIIGNVTSPANCIINKTTTGACFSANEGAILRVTGFTVQSSGAIGIGVTSTGGASLIYGAMRFGGCTYCHIGSSTSGSTAPMTSNQAYTVFGGATHHIAAGGGTTNVAGTVTTISGNPAFTIFALSNGNSLIFAPGATYSGACTGQRFQASNGGNILTNVPGNLSFFPGSTAGTSTTGYYV